MKKKNKHVQEVETAVVETPKSERGFLERVSDTNQLEGEIAKTLNNLAHFLIHQVGQYNDDKRENAERAYASNYFLETASALNTNVWKEFHRGLHKNNFLYLLDYNEGIERFTLSDRLLSVGGRHNLKKFGEISELSAREIMGGQERVYVTDLAHLRLVLEKHGLSLRLDKRTDEGINSYWNIEHILKEYERKNEQTK